MRHKWRHIRWCRPCFGVVLAHMAYSAGFISMIYRNSLYRGRCCNSVKKQDFLVKTFDFFASGFNFCTYTATDAVVGFYINGDGAAVMSQFANETTNAATALGSSSHSLRYTDARHTTQRNKLLTRRQIYNKNVLLKLFFVSCSKQITNFHHIFLKYLNLAQLLLAAWPTEEMGC